MEEAESSSWSSRRKFSYTLGVVLVLTAISFSIFWKFWYQAPTCSDHLKNGDETGIDCGGKCTLICSAEALSPVMRGDPRLFLVSPTNYSVLAILENRNISFSAPAVHYTFTIYDKAGATLYTRAGVTNLPKNKTSAIFEGNINIQGAVPARVSFVLDNKITWIKDVATDPEISIEHTPLSNQDKNPRIESTVKNNSLSEINNLEIVSVVLDGKDNTIAASRTFVDRLKKGETTDVFFTWPLPFSLGENICEKPSAVVLVIDRSGSMSALGANPPQPLTDVKSAATSFLANLKSGDTAAVVSFASLASSPIDQGLTADFSLAKTAIDKIAISSSTKDRDTNIADSLGKATEALSTISNPNVKKVVILLTDGNPTQPQKAGDDKWPFTEADRAATTAKNQEITLFTIGLGKDIDETFLRNLVSSTSNYFAAPSAVDLNKIYEKISTAICKEVPARIELYSKLLDR